MPRRNPLVAAAALVAAVAAPASASASRRPCPGGDRVPTAATIAKARHSTLCLLNHVRHQHGLRRLRPSGKLRSAAQAYSWAMVRNDFFDHVPPQGSTLLGRVRKTAYLSSARGWALGENIAWGSGPLATPRRTMKAWMHSAGHRHNILTGRFTEIGIGIAPGAPVRLPDGLAAATYTTDFGTRH
ncbi:MAG TPA: CAP domain-containing protein [Solirubrobacteraceae bacterium]